MKKLLNEKANAIVTETEQFLKKAFSADGTCKYLKLVKLNDFVKLDVDMRKSTPEHGTMFELTDSERGTFYVTLSTKPSLSHQPCKRN